MFRPVAILSMLLAVAGCAGAPVRPAIVQDVQTAATVTAPPLLRLAPSALPGGLALQQRLSFRHGDRRDTVDALVEADAGAVRVLVHMQGQVALRLDWDGETLQQTRADWLPPQLQGERVLSDLQLVYWPREAIAAALPPEWSLASAQGERFLVHVPSGERVVGIDYLADGIVVLKSLDPRRDFELRIESTPVTP